MRRLLAVLALTVIAAGCGGSDVDISEVQPLPTISAEELGEILTTSTTPVVVNVWASWCVPCRSEAPLLERAAATADVRFIGLNVRDNQEGARSFIAEFFPDAPIEHLFDALARGDQRGAAHVLLCGRRRTRHPTYRRDRRAHPCPADR